MRFIPSVERRRFINAIRRRLLPNTKWMKTMILGRPFAVETKEWEQWMYDYEPATTDYLKNHVKRGDIALDIGAHVGYYTLLFAELVGPDGRVYAFEPNPDMMKVLKFNVKSNGFENVTFIQKAASDFTGKTRLYVPEVTDTASLNPMTGVRKIIEIESVRVDDLNIGQIDFVKIDVEGAEFRVLKGMDEALYWNPEAKLIVEFCPENLGNAVSPLLQLLQDYNKKGMDRNILFHKFPMYDDFFYIALSDEVPK